MRGGRRLADSASRCAKRAKRAQADSEAAAATEAPTPEAPATEASPGGGQSPGQGASDPGALRLPVAAGPFRGRLGRFSPACASQ